MLPHMIGLFDKIEPTLENMNSIAEFNKIIKNYLKMKRIENEPAHNTTKRPKRTRRRVNV